MIFRELTKEEYTAFEAKSPQVDFMNRPEAYEAKILNGWETVLLGVTDDAGKVLAATLLASIPVMKIYRYFYAQRGLLADYGDEAVLRFFTENLKKYCHARKGLYLLCDPVVFLRERDIDGNIVEGGFDHSDVIRTMEKVGWQHQGLGIGYTTAAYARFMFTLHLAGETEESVYKKMHSQTRWSINKTLKQCVEVREIGLDELDIFLRMMDETAERRSFYAREHDFFRNTIAAYGEHGRTLVAYLDIPKYRERLEEEKAALEQEIAETEAWLAETPTSRKYQTKLRVAKEALDLNTKKFAEADALEQEHGSVINMATSFFTVYDDEVTYLYSGTDDRFRKYNAPYAIQWYMIREAIRLGIDRYNFYGISGDFDKDSPDYGVYDFKRGFGGVVEELVGDFVLPIRPAAYAAYRKLKHE